MAKLQEIVANARRTTEKRLPRNQIAALGDHGFSVFSAVTKDPLEDVLLVGYLDALTFVQPWDRIELVADCESDEPTFARLVVTGVEMVDGAMVKRPDAYTNGTNTADKHGGRRHVHVAVCPGTAGRARWVGE
jgi:hypothetical protein